ncbi:hypothetical protein QBC45DRAFT_404684 [Copromyces sp. CBS 386.78]|nr:hypothetical protein QBC45DRAFT_404684 [Copromyces sp. CBS 386.78]
MEAEEEEHDDDWRCAGSDMMRRRCNAASWLAGWLAGTGPAEQEGETPVERRPKKHQATHQVHTIWRDRSSHGNQSPTKNQRGFRIQSRGRTRRLCVQ